MRGGIGSEGGREGQAGGREWVKARDCMRGESLNLFGIGDLRSWICNLKSWVTFYVQEPGRAQTMKRIEPSCLPPHALSAET